MQQEGNEAGHAEGRGDKDGVRVDALAAVPGQQHLPPVVGPVEDVGHREDKREEEVAVRVSDDDKIVVLKRAVSMNCFIWKASSKGVIRRNRPFGFFVTVI